MKIKISTVINYCTNDYRYLKMCIDSVMPFSNEVIIPVCDHFFNGEKENRFLLNRSYEEHPECRFIEYPFPKERPYGKNPPIGIEDVNFKHYMHSTSRYFGYLKSDLETDFVLFLDVDEIVETKRFIEWLHAFDFSNVKALRFYNYFYFREASYRSKSGHSINALLVNKKALDDPEKILTIYERRGLYLTLETDEQPIIMGLDGHPLFHHYSWVRTQEELEKKVTTWGHAHEDEWLKKLDEEFSQDFIFIDSVFYNLYENVNASHDPLEICVPKDPSTGEKKMFLHVDYLS
jgi:hypothetical protein